MYNPSAVYYHSPEVLRQNFYKSSWNLSSCERNTAICVNIRNPLRGCEVIFNAMEILKRGSIELNVAFAGSLLKSKSGYSRYLWRQAHRLGIENQVSALGFLEQGDLIRHMRNAQIFLLASFLENSSNSLCEAQVLGMPCIASRVGGITSLVDEGKTGVLFDAGDPAMLADCILNLLECDEKAASIGQRARAEGLKRHDPRGAVAKLVDVYSDILSKENASN